MGGMSKRRTGRRPTERSRDIRYVREHGFDSVAFAFNLGKELGHFVAVEFVLGRRQKKRVN